MRWDEGNLIENEKLKAEMDIDKITEPKTPYHASVKDPEGGGWSTCVNLYLSNIDCKWTLKVSSLRHL